jgi:myosin protein heavy chain
LSLSRSASTKENIESFDVSPIPSLPQHGDSDEEASVPEDYLPPAEEDDVDEHDLSLSEALESISRTSSPYPTGMPDVTPKTAYFEYYEKLKSEPKVCTVFSSEVFYSNVQPIAVSKR